MKFSVNMYLMTSKSLLTDMVIRQGTVFLCVCMILLEPVGLDSRMLHKRGPRAVLSLEQGLAFLFRVGFAKILNATHLSCRCTKVMGYVTSFMLLCLCYECRSVSNENRCITLKNHILHIGKT